MHVQYCFKRRERVSKGIRRIARDQLDRAQKELRGRCSDAAIHRARKRLKVVRAVLRLVRPDLKPAVFDRENAAFRDIGRRLSVVRDADVLLDVIEDLGPRRTRSARFGRVVSHVRQHRRSVRREFFDGEGALDDLRQSIADARKRLPDWTEDGITARTILKGLRRSYRRARQSLEAVRHSENDGRWHECRKRTKDFWYHLRLIEPIWPPVLDATIARCGDLSDRLGEDHDLTVVGHRLPEIAPEGEAHGETSRIRSLIAHRHEALRAGAREAGSQLFDEKPRAFVRRVDACWRAWKD
jgi:CHAD domain-containing protein